ncbi:MAG: 4Fe-4S binding protein [Armatimonadota bacterium]
MADETKVDRRGFLKAVARAVGALGLGVGVGAVAAKGERDDLVWQIDPEKCIACGNCATACVLTPSAARCVHDVEICGYCDFCFGYFAEVRPSDEETAENLRCPTDAIERNFVEEPYYEYLIDEPKCIGCAICVEGCQQYGNGSLVMQVRHNYCVDCNECAIAVQCPADAFVRVPADDPYLLRSLKLAEEEEGDHEEAEQAPRPPEPTDSQPTPDRPSPLETPPPDQEFPSEGMREPGFPDPGGGMSSGEMPPESPMPGDDVDPSQNPGLHL